MPHASCASSATLLHMSCMTFPTLSVGTLRLASQTIVCKSKLCKTATQGREHQMRLQVYAKVHDTKLETSKEVENRWNCDVYIYMQCAHRNAFMCIAHIICNVHCPLRTDSAYRGRFAGNIIWVESTGPLLAFQNPLKCLWCHTLAILLDVINSYGQLANGKLIF